MNVTANTSTRRLLNCRIRDLNRYSRRTLESRLPPYKKTAATRPRQPTTLSSEWPPDVDDVYIPDRGVLTTPMAASYLGLSPATLETMRTRGGGPVFAKLGRRVVYQREDLDSWVEERRRKSTIDAGD